MAVILRKLKGKPVLKEDHPPEYADWQHLLRLIKVLVVLFVIFSGFHWIVKKKVQQLPVQSTMVQAETKSDSNQKAGEQRLYTVKEGDTLWSLAVRLYPKDNPEKKIKEIQAVNGLHGDTIKPGQAIRLP